MFTSFETLKRKTPENGINRKEYIKHLIEEYYTTTDIEAQEQVTANLANFAYDPLNWDYLIELEALQLFLGLLKETNENLQLHGAAGLCNIYADINALKFLTEEKNFLAIQHLLLNSQKKNILLNLLTLVYQIVSISGNEIKVQFLNSIVLKKIKSLQSEFSADQKLKNITTVLLEDFGQRYEVFEIRPSMATTAKNIQKTVIEQR